VHDRACRNAAQKIRDIPKGKMGHVPNRQKAGWRTDMPVTPHKVWALLKDQAIAAE